MVVVLIDWVIAIAGVNKSMKYDLEYMLLGADGKIAA